MLGRMSITVGLRNYRVVPDSRAEFIDCNCARAEILCPEETTLGELAEAVRLLSEYETPRIVSLPLQAVS
jgi:hypothetical protein